MRLVLIALLVGGCAASPTAEQMEARLRVLYGNDCTRQGYKEYTDPHDRCIIAAYMREQEAKQAAQAGRNRALADQMSRDSQRNTEAMQRAFQPPAKPVDCTTTYYGGVARTTCQ